MKKNRFILYAIALLQGMVFYAPVATLYRQAQGVSFFEISVIESVSLALYDAIFGAQFRYPAVILTRGISYYLPLLVSGAVTLGTRISQLRGKARASK